MITADIKTATPKLNATIGGGATGKGNVTSVNKKIGDVVLTASDIHFLDGENFQEKYNSGELRGQKGDTGKAGEKGKDGTNGKNGKDGVSPMASVKQGVGEATIIITDSEGTTTAVLKDGKTYDDTQVKANTKAINEGVPYNTLTGKSVTANDVSSYEHPVECTVSGVENPEKVKVQRTGKNLIPYPYKKEEFDNHFTFDIKDDGTVIVNGEEPNLTAAKTIIRLTEPFLLFKKGTYTFSGCNHAKSEAEDWHLTFTEYDLNNKYLNEHAVRTGKKVITLAEDRLCNIQIVYAKGEMQNEVFKPMLEMGDTSSEPFEFELYHEPQTLIPNPDGTVAGMTSVSPTMIVTTDNPNANLSVKYQLEPQNQIQENEARVITAELKIAELEKKLQTALMSMGGNV